MMSRVRSAIGSPVGSFVLGNSDPVSLPSDSNIRLHVNKSPSRPHENDEVCSASFKPSRNQNQQIIDRGEFFHAEGENHSLAKLVQSLQDRLDAHDKLFKKSYARGKRSNKRG
ncbi:unnamed protein product [Ilex paraguariensis]|uniref:Uncharacterized protein n=1 Tax=Ilex paraguariensis TaxID=185542 RepID=A0ABC8TSB4_9AQUA